MDATQRVQSYYDENAQDEWDRLERHPVERVTTQHFLSKYLPDPPARVFDIGGGPGRYSIWLRQQGYDVTLLDLSSSNLKLAEEKAAEAGVDLKLAHSSATDLSFFADDAFDVILLMGPLYHLITLKDRQQALSEARRVLKPGGRIFASFITMSAAIRAIAMLTPDNLEAEWRTLQHGVNDPDLGFTEAHFTYPDEVETLMREGGFIQENLIGCEGVLATHEEPLIGLTEEQKEMWFQINLRFAESRTALEASDHILYIGHKPA